MKQSTTRHKNQQHCVQQVVNNLEIMNGMKDNLLKNTENAGHFIPKLGIFQI